jgi:hypothetical protein
MQSTRQKDNIFSEEGLCNIVAFLEILRRIHARLIAEGYVLKNGVFVKPDDSDKSVKVNPA